MNTSAGESGKLERKAQDEKGDGEMDRRALLTMAQELQDQGLYVKQLEAQLPSDS